MRKSLFSDVILPYFNNLDMEPSYQFLKNFSNSKLNQMKNCKARIKNINFYQLCKKSEHCTYIIQGNQLFDPESYAPFIPAYFQFDPFEEALVIIANKKIAQVFKYVPVAFKQPFVSLRLLRFLEPRFQEYYVFKMVNEELVLCKNFEDTYTEKEIWALSKVAFKHDELRTPIVLKYYIF